MLNYSSILANFPIDKKELTKRCFMYRGRPILSFEVNVWTLIGGFVSIGYFVFFIGQKFEKYENLLTIPPRMEALSNSIASIQQDMKLQAVQQSSENAAMRAELVDLRARVSRLESE